MNITEKDIEQLVQKTNQVLKQLSTVVIGQEATVRNLLITLFAGGHALIEGVPGLGKTLMVRALAKTTDMDFSRIQFTPDLMPSDIIGTDILMEHPETGKRYFEFVKGPLFGNLILADEINRTPPKTQSALLEAMQEKAVSFSGKHHQMELPYCILATQNPLEQSGTFRLPEAQLDRFLFYLKLNYPSAKDELSIFTERPETKIDTLTPILSKTEIVHIQKIVQQIPVSPSIIEKVLKLVRNTRPEETTVAIVKEKVAWGAGTRAGLALLTAARARAFLNNRLAVLDEDIQALAIPVLRHRILLNYEAIAGKVTTDEIVEELGIKYTKN